MEKAMLEKIVRFDNAAVIFIHTRLRSKALDYFFIGATYLGSDVFAIGLILGLLLLPGAYFTIFAKNSALALLVSSVTVAILKYYVKRKRPFEVILELESLKIGIDQFSFPSGHTTAAFALAATIAFLTPSAFISTIYVLLAFIVALSRIYLGVHYPSDVTAGAVIGTFCAILVHFVILG